MKKYLFIAEKPSLMRDVRDCYNNHKAELNQKVGLINFVALSGHVCTNGTPEDYDAFQGRWDEVEYPMIPKQWIIKPIDDNYKKKTLKDIKSAISNYDGVIVGTDSDVEGYGIYYLLEQYLHLQNVPALRFIEHSLTDSEILKSLLTMTDYHKDPIHQQNVKSFLLRSQADWLYGMNCTRLMTLKTDRLMTIGRVKAPTIKLVYDNSMSIEKFVPQKYYQCIADYGTYQGTQVDKNGTVLNYKEQKQMSVPLDGKVFSVTKEAKKTHAPQLYDLTALQTEAGQRFGFTPAEVLELVQSLYEKHKVISYPRTQCRYVSSEKSKEFEQMIKQSVVFQDLAPFVGQITKTDISRVQKDKKVINDAEVTKESHDALLPTSKTPKLNEMTEKERLICELIYKRLLAQFLPQLEECKTKMILDHNGTYFLVHGKTVSNLGWRALYGQLKDVVLPDLKENDVVHAKKIGMVEKITTPPKRLTQATLLLAMRNIANQIEDPVLRKSLAESQGIGTPATRDAIITDIIKRGYVEDKGKKGLFITKEGIDYIEQAKEVEIISPIFAATLDTEIKKIQRGELDYDIAYRKMLEKLNEICKQIESLKAISTQTISCPKCNGSMNVKRYSYECPDCNLSINKNICGVSVSEDVLKELKEKGITKSYKFTKKDKTTFQARLKLVDDGLSFDFSSGIICPRCKKEMTKNKGGCFCECGLKVFRNCYGKTLTDNQLETLIKNGNLKNVSGFVSKSGEKYKAGLKIVDDHVELDR